MDKNNFEKDIDVPSKRLDRIDKMEIDLANYEQMERDIENIIEPYQLNWELDCLSLPSAIQSILERKEQECERWKSNFNGKVSAIEDLLKQLDQLKAENDELRKNLVDKHTSRCFRLVTHREFDKLIMETVQLRQENKKLKQTLTEIKEIAEENSLAQVGYNPDWDIILQKINECEVNNESK